MSQSRGSLSVQKKNGCERTRNDPSSFITVPGLAGGVGVRKGGVFAGVGVAGTVAVAAGVETACAGGVAVAPSGGADSQPLSRRIASIKPTAIRRGFMRSAISEYLCYEMGVQT